MTETHKENSEAEIGVMLPWAKECMGHQKLEEARKDSFLNFQMKPDIANT